MNFKQIKSEQTFIQEDIHMINKHMNRCSHIFSIREVQISTTMRPLHTNWYDQNQKEGGDLFG